MSHNRTKAQKREALDKLAYEIKMLSHTGLVLIRKRKRNLSWVYHNSTIHSFLLAVRNLHDFYFAKKSSKDGIIATAILTTWSCPAPEFREGRHWKRIDPRKHIRRRTPFNALVSQRLHHITWSRVDESKINWIESAILREFLEPTNRFASALPESVRTPYFDQSVRLLARTCNSI